MGRGPRFTGRRPTTYQKLSVAEVARRLDVSETLLRAWRKAVLASGDAAFPGHGNLPPAEDELRCLRTENARLRASRPDSPNEL